ncbi:peptide ABC transporter substrate-binding protein [Paracoccus pacificus]|uniref:Peptide ABC transporter substrate-binding protein n=1 Tax=Paracoccus pacificus TaxID=1463598 RepID=A0ABW4R8K6_9RHOB
MAKHKRNFFATVLPGGVFSCGVFVLAAMPPAPAFAVQPQPGETLAAVQEYRYWLPDAIKTLDPQMISTPDEGDAVRQLFEGLMNEDATGAPVPGVADSVDVSGDGLTYRFHLRPGAKWSNGDPVTADDFVYAWRRLADPGTAAEYGDFVLLMNLANAEAVQKGDADPADLGVAAVDDRTLQVTLSRPTPSFLTMVTNPVTFPVPRKIIEAAGAGWTRPGTLVGNGAYVLSAHDLATGIEMTKNPAYWDAANVVMARVTGEVLANPQQAVDRFAAGTLDRAPVPLGQPLPPAISAPGSVQRIPAPCTYAFLFNLGEKGPQALKDVRVRAALSYTFPRDEVTRDILQGAPYPAYSWTHRAIQGVVMPPVDYAGWTQPQRIEQARGLLTEAGFGPENPLELTLRFNTDPLHRKIAEAAARAWQPLGVKLSLDDADWRQQAEWLRTGDFQIARYAWCADYNDAASFLNFMTSDGPNPGGYRNADFDRLMQTARTAPDPAADYGQAELILSQDMPLIPVYHYARATLLSPRIKGVSLQNAMGHWLAKDMYRVE